MHLDPTRPPVVWLRNKFFSFVIGDLDDQRRRFESNSREAVIRTLIDCFSLQVINRSTKFIAPESKGLQTVLAKKCELMVPLTAVSSDRARMKKFVGACDSTIMKAIGRSWVESFHDKNGKFHDVISVMTNNVRLNELAGSTDAEVSSVPCILQQEVVKEYELRSIFVGGEILHYRVNSQRRELTKLDWRMGERLPNLIDPQPHSRSASFDDKIRNLMAALELEVGVLDFAVTPQGEEVFFECNPNGQWALLEQKEDPTISEAVAAHFDRKIQAATSKTSKRFESN